MTNERALLAAINAKPDDDTVRVVYADFLEENGESERAEFIRLQVELARGVKKASERQALERRQRGLLAANKSRWVAPLKQALGQGRWRRVGVPPRIRRVFRTARQDGRVARGEVGRSHSRPRVDRDPGNNRPGGRPVQATRGWRT